MRLICRWGFKVYMLHRHSYFSCKKLFKQVTEGTFMEEPGSGAVATVENKKVSVGTLDWVRRYLTHWSLCIKCHWSIV